tara:strand:- start:37044 stop:37340 length:297 start_codon:yes stop_codon:yes gene_type:complete
VISIDGLFKAFENRIRIGIMSALSVNDSVDFNSLKEYLDSTDGNLASHLKGLENEGYIVAEKSFAGRRRNTSYCITEKGRIAFTEHLKTLEKIIRAQK